MPESLGRNQQAQTPERTNRQALPFSQRKQNVSNRKAVQDGALSDGALISGASATPRSKKAHRPKQTGASGPIAHKYNSNVSDGGQRPASRGTASIPTPVKEDDMRYAGAVFSSSPAPNSLPVPKFAKSMSSAVRSPDLLMKTHVRSPSDAVESSPEAGPASPAIAPSSPLELFFRADRAEKARTQSAVVSPQDRKKILFANMNGEVPTGASPLPQRPGLDRIHTSPGAASAVGSEEERTADTQRLKALLFNASNASPTTPQYQAYSASTIPGGQSPSPSPSNRPSFNPAPPDSEWQEPQGYHYGNRNLTPLFKAARSDMPIRPSGLSRETSRQYDGPAASPSGQHPFDPNFAARRFLNDSIAAHENSRAPHHASTYLTRPQINIADPKTVTAQHQPWNGASALDSSPKTAPKDTSTMENDLRRILKLDSVR